MRKFLVVAVLCTCATVASAQVGEFSIGGGVSSFGDGGLGTLDSSASSGEATMDGGFRLALRFNLNPYRFFGHEFGYAYNRASVSLPGQGEISVPAHQVFYSFLVHATPEGSRVRPFVAGGGHFTSFFPPGASVYYGNQITKFGFNYGAGIKIRATEVWGLRFDVRQYNTGQPFDFFNQPGRLKQTEITGGITFNF
jgi:opacity protein-like surface antigen